MQRSLTLLFALASLNVAACAQSAPDSSSYMQSQAAPIQRNYAQRANAPSRVTSTQPIEGVILRVDPASSVQTVSATPDVTELRITSGRANVSVHHPEHGSQILVDLPGGQTALLKDGLYTFNADTNTVRVLKGEAKVFPGSKDADIKVKEDHKFTFGASPRAQEVSFTQARADLLPGSTARTTYRAAYNGDGPYAPYAYGYPYYPYGFYGNPYWGYGYPFGFGVGFGYYGGFRGGFGGFHHFR